VLVFIDHVAEIFLAIGILLMVEVVMLIEYGAELVDGVEEEADETFFWQEGAFG
jgi:hypothetical protein